MKFGIANLKRWPNKISDEGTLYSSIRFLLWMMKFAVNSEIKVFQILFKFCGFESFEQRLYDMVHILAKLWFASSLGLGYLINYFVLFPVRRSSLSTDDGSLSDMSKKFPDRKTSIFSLSDIQEDMEKEELLRRLQQEEEEKRLEVNDYITYSKVDSSPHWRDLTKE